MSSIAAPLWTRPADGRRRAVAQRPGEGRAVQGAGAPGGAVRRPPAPPARRRVGGHRGAAARGQPAADVDVIGNGVPAEAFDDAAAVRATTSSSSAASRSRRRASTCCCRPWARACERLPGTLVVAGTGPDEQAAACPGRRSWAGRPRAASSGGSRAGEVRAARARRGWSPCRAGSRRSASSRWRRPPRATPVVAFDIDCLREVVPDACGRRVHAFDVEAYAEALVATHVDTGLRVRRPLGGGRSRGASTGTPRPPGAGAGLPRRRAHAWPGGHDQRQGRPSGAPASRRRPPVPRQAQRPTPAARRRAASSGPPLRPTDGFDWVPTTDPLDRPGRPVLRPAVGRAEPPALGSSGRVERPPRRAQSRPERAEHTGLPTAPGRERRGGVGARRDWSSSWRSTARVHRPDPCQRPLHRRAHLRRPRVDARARPAARAVRRAVLPPPARRPAPRRAPRSGCSGCAARPWTWCSHAALGARRPRCRVGAARLPGRALRHHADGCAVAGLVLALDPFVLRNDTRVMLETPMTTFLRRRAARAARRARPQPPGRVRTLLEVCSGLLLGCAVFTKDMSAVPVAVLLVLGCSCGAHTAARHGPAGRRAPCRCRTSSTSSVVAPAGLLPAWWEAKTFGLRRMVGAEQVTGFNMPNAPSLVSRLVVQVSRFGTSYVLLAGCLVVGVARRLQRRPAPAGSSGSWRWGRGCSAGTRRWPARSRSSSATSSWCRCVLAAARARRGSCSTAAGCVARCCPSRPCCSSSRRPCSACSRGPRHDDGFRRVRAWMRPRCRRLPGSGSPASRRSSLCSRIPATACGPPCRRLRATTPSTCMTQSQTLSQGYGYAAPELLTWLQANARPVFSFTGPSNGATVVWKLDRDGGPGCRGGRRDASPGLGRVPMRRAAALAGSALALASALAGCDTAAGAPPSRRTAADRRARRRPAPPERAAAQARAGIRLAVLDIAWDRYEPQPGTFDDAYAAERPAAGGGMRERRCRGRARARAAVPAARGCSSCPRGPIATRRARAPDPPVANLVFSRAVREAAAGYLRSARRRPRARAASRRSGSAPPIPASSATRVPAECRAYWAFDEAAQGGAGLADGSRGDTRCRAGRRARRSTSEQVTPGSGGTPTRPWPHSAGRSTCCAGSASPATCTCRWPGAARCRRTSPRPSRSGCGGTGPDGALGRGLDYPAQFAALARLDAPDRAGW